MIDDVIRYVKRQELGESDEQEVLTALGLLPYKGADRVNGHAVSVLRRAMTDEDMSTHKMMGICPRFGKPAHSSGVKAMGSR